MVKPVRVTFQQTEIICLGNETPEAITDGRTFLAGGFGLWLYLAGIEKVWLPW